MKMSPWLCLLFACVLGLAAAWTVPPYDLEKAELYFERFIEEHERQYADEFEKQARLVIFKENLEHVNQLNEMSDHAEYGISQFMDLTLEEFQNMYTGFRPNSSDFASGCTRLTDQDVQYKDAPESFDWRDHGVVGHPRDQQGCGSCYAFGVIGNIEGQYALKHKEQVELSVQQIVDCDKRNYGCSGGLMHLAIESLIEQGGCEYEHDYPYEAMDGNCRFIKNKVKVQVTDCHIFDLKSQEKLKQLLFHNGPIVIGIKSRALHKYKGGIINDATCNEGRLDHAVLLVGYGIEDNIAYWIVRNSWADFWGEHGYFRVQRGEGFDSCGMMNDDMCSAIVA